MTRKQPLSGIDEFRLVLTDYKSLGPWILGGTIFVPLVDYLIRLGPPWPDGLAAITSVVELLILISVFHFGYRSGLKRVSRRMIVALALLIMSFSVYLFLNSVYTFNAGSNSAKYVKGFVVRPDVAQLIGPQFTADDALANSEYRAEDVWTSYSIAIMRLTLLFLWLLSFALLTTTIASFVIYHRRKRA